MELELQQLDLRYDHLRVMVPRREKSLVASIAEAGQLVPIAVVLSQEDPTRHVVIDGFKRIRALRRLRQDMVRSVRWELSELEALVLMRSLRSSDGESILEQAWLLDELQGRFNLTMEELGRKFDRGRSWISRRLALVRELPESVQEQVRQGRIAPHAGAKYLVPVARANRDECERLAHSIGEHRLSSRDVGELYAGWRDGDPSTRERLIAEPVLYLRARRSLAEESQESPQEGLRKDVAMICAALRRARLRMREGAGVGLSPLDHEGLLAGLQLARSDTRRLIEILEHSLEGCDARPEHADGDSGAGQARTVEASDREDTEDLTRSGCAGAGVGDG